jgi:hypothetical protein
MKALLLTSGATAMMAMLGSVAAQTFQINSLPYTISVPGDYQLERNLHSTAPTLITIVTGDVTLDLNGHTLSSTSSQYAIHVKSVQNVVIKNGSIRNPEIPLSPQPGGVGIFLDGAFGCLIKDLSIASKQEAILDTAVSFGGNNLIRDCMITVYPSLKPAITIQNTNGDLIEHNLIYCEAYGVLDEGHSPHATNVIKDNVVNSVAGGGLSIPNDWDINNVVANDGL